MCVWVIGLRETMIKLSHYRMKNHYIRIVVGKSLGKQPFGVCDGELLYLY
jgi:hypothetical protein